MNILLLTNCIVQPDDTDKSVNDIVFSFAKEWKKAGNNVVIINNESKFPIMFYCAPKFLIKILKKRDNVTIPSLASRRALQWEKDGVVIKRLPMFKIYPHASFRAAQYIRQKEKIVELLNDLSFDPDVITGHWIEPQLKLIDLLGDYYNAKKALVIHGELNTNFKEEYKKIISRLDVLFFRSKCVRDKMCKLFSEDFIDPQKVKICFSGIPDKFVNTQIVRNDWSYKKLFKVVFVGRLEQYKRVDSILYALIEAFPNKDFHFTIVGDGPQQENLIKICCELGITNQVTFTGRVSRCEVIEKMNAADCFAMISENEVFGLVYLEAMACGCLTIASYNGGVDGIIENGKNGFLCIQGDSKNLAEIFVNIRKYPEDKAQKIRNKSYQTVHYYTDSNAAQCYLDNICGNENKK